tara:strand:- start:5472 stop:6308 length:837 start_codon:yes stop_codon:yes gene_type:complete
MTEFFIKLGKVDRRYIFIIIAIVVIVPLLKPIGLPIRPTQSSQMVFDSIESLPRGSKILMSFEYGPSTKPEIHPMAIGVLRHAFRNDHQVYVTCLWPDGLFMALEALKDIADDEFGKVYGEDYVLLGFRPGNEAVVKGIVSDIRKLYTIDARNTLVEDIPMMEGINKFEDFNYLFTFSAGFPGTIEWVQYAADPTGIPMSTGVTSIQVNEVKPYEQSGQVKGILAGMPGAAEYESLIEQKGGGIAGMDAQSIAHLVIVLFIIFGNIAFYLERQRAKKY